MNEILQAALNFHDAGISVVPVASDGTKKPIGSWAKYQVERASREQIIDWFSGDCIGLGIVTGTVSGSLEMAEFEGRAIASGLLDEARELAQNSGLGNLWEILVNGYVELTPSGGLHFLYRIADESVPGNTKIARRPGENDGVEVLVETRGEGGMVIVAPSHSTTHQSGQPWVMLKGSPATIPMFSWEERCAIHDIFKALDSMPVKEAIAERLNPKDATGDKPGDQFNAKASWREILEPLGWKIVYTARGVTYWCRPGKTMGISATTGKNDGDNLYVFTTSTTFEAERPYSKFAAFAHLHHNGDFSAAARDLRMQGYGAIPTASNLSSLPSLTQSHPMEALLSIVPSTPTDQSSWKPVDLNIYFDGTYKIPETSILTRNDGQSLLYPGKVHSFYGESESGKSWLAQIAVAEQLRAFKKVIYIDFESDAADLVTRLQALKVTQPEILQNFTYIRPDTKRDHEDPYWQALLEPNCAALVIIDGVTEALTMWGGETKDNDAITLWMRLFPRAIAEASGACVVQIDHVTKNSDTRGRFAIGGQAKLATIDGAAFLIEPLEALAPGRIGVLTMRVTKDRPGFIRKISGMYRKSDRTQESAVITIDSTKSKMETIISPPLLEDQVVALALANLDNDIVKFIDSNPGTTKGKAVKGVEHKSATVLTRIDELIEEGVIENRGNAKSYILYMTVEGKAKYNLSSAMILHLGSGQK